MNKLSKLLIIIESRFKILRLKIMEKIYTFELDLSYRNDKFYQELVVPTGGRQGLQSIINRSRQLQDRYRNLIQMARNL